MTEDLKSLIEKIQQEGVAAGQHKAKEIEDRARTEARQILEKAKAEAKKLLADAKEEIKRTEESSRVSLKQAGRDLMLSLHKEIALMLDRLLNTKVREALSAEEMTKLIVVLVRECRGKDDVTICLKKEDLEKVQKALFAELKEEAKKGITLKSTDEISAGFLISFDAGKSHFDFSDKALADYMVRYLKPQLKDIFQE
ncbi:MAG: hypothetical protein V1863_02520 [Candidatus Omnitrophota bacterium]